MRRRSAEKRPLLPDPKFGDQTVTRFVNRLMLSGKKSIAEKILYKALDILVTRVKSGDEGDEGESSSQARAVVLLNKALHNVAPVVEVRARRIGGATYQVPVEVPPNRRLALAIRWIIVAASKRGDHGMVKRLAAELSDAVVGRGEAVKKREDTYRMAKANQAYAHFRIN